MRICCAPVTLIMVKCRTVAFLLTEAHLCQFSVEMWPEHILRVLESITLNGAAAQLLTWDPA